MLRWLAPIAAAFLSMAPVVRADVDGDGIPDESDNCPYAMNPDQEDGGGVGSPAPDQIGDACQCGDLSGDGVADLLDIALYQRSLAALGPPLAAPEKCDVSPTAGVCDAEDALRLRIAVAGGAPRIAQICTPAQPPAPVCGNGSLETGEACDRSDFGGDDCTTYGFSRGMLSCKPDCQVDTSGCIPPGQAGEACNAGSDCAAGLSCADGVCCTSACLGTCMACDLAGSLGQCTTIPSGQDPDAECPGLSCSAYYLGWSGDSCMRKADVSAAQATCNGSGACRSQAQECGAQTLVGPIALTCHSTCQDPDFGTCSGTLAGTCLNVNPGTQTCGVGVCQRTVNRCAGGAPLTCSPGAPASESCNNLDDNCDGAIDNGAFADVREPNADCASADPLPQIGSDQTLSVGSLTVYPSGDLDFYRIRATETDGSCGCGIFSLDEDYDMRVTLAVPANAGSYEICMDGLGCNFPSGFCFVVGAGASLTLTQGLDGACSPGQTDAYDVYVRVRGLGSPGFECAPYTLDYSFDAGLCR